MKTYPLLEYSREADGVTMIAICSQGRTKLGRMLAAGASIPVHLNERGGFASLSAFIRYINGDRRTHVREERGPDYDEALNDQVAEPYHDLLQSYVRAMLLSPRATEAGMLGLLQKNNLPFAVYQDADGELVPMPLPLWYAEVLNQLRTQVGATRAQVMDAKAKNLEWDATVFEFADKPRSLAELQAAYVEMTQGTSESSQFLVSQAEYESIPEDVRQIMASTIDLQIVFEGKYINPPTRK